MSACGTPVAAVYVDHAPGNIRLSECAQCGFAADEYVECEMMVIIRFALLVLTRISRSSRV
ncbi:hypothetical protein KC19_5G197400 [Ceratodon purpureus]|uniref:Protein ARV n=1 Tax=Ceratodon purpureus TaxID=3225 RepID=A0A8T0I3F3_CERPU|nr:hypothetical protein KC19_5G197400 [Ceratodon purpureus]